MKLPIARQQGRFISLRFKLLIAFSIVFTAIFAMVFIRSYRYSTDKAMERLREDMEVTLLGAAAGVDVEELMDLYAEGEPNSEQFSDDPRFENQLDWLELVQSIEPRAWLYTYIPGNRESVRRIGEPATGYEVIFLVDLWAEREAEKAAKFLESYSASRWMAQSLETGQLMQRPEPYTDFWGNWISAYAPLFDSAGNVVAGIGIDIEMDYVRTVQQGILVGTLRWFTAAYGSLFLLIYWLSGVLTSKLTHLTRSARLIGTGNYDIDVGFDRPSSFPDELDTLAEVFDTTIDRIRTREQLIREVKQTEDEMRHALEEERELNELTSRFVSMVSHELRTPLTVVRTSTELLEHYSDRLSEAKQEEYYQRIRGAIQNMAQLIDDVLVAGKAEAGKLDFEPVPLELAKYCRELIEEIRVNVQSNHTLTFAWHGGGEETVMDPKLLRIILSNLLFNAIKYSPAGSTVEIELFCIDLMAVFEIRDRGIGIPVADQPHLFKSFHRARNVGAIRGTGLGLAIVKHCVNHHHGQVTFVSQEGQGTTFVVKLPLKP